MDHFNAKPDEVSRVECENAAHAVNIHRCDQPRIMHLDP